MKWYKHLTTSLDDPHIFEAIELFGGDGYLVFFGILELVAKEFTKTKRGEVTFPVKFLTQKLQVSRHKLTKILTFYSEKSSGFREELPRLSYTMTTRQITLNCPKLNGLSDNYTKQSLRSSDEATSKSLQTIEDRREKKEVKDKKKVPEKTPVMLRIESWFNRRESNPWNAKMIKAFKDLGEIPEEDLDMLEARYTSTDPDTMQFRKQKLPTLLNDWFGQLDICRNEPQQQTLGGPNPLG